MDGVRRRRGHTAIWCFQTCWRPYLNGFFGRGDGSGGRFCRRFKLCAEHTTDHFQAWDYKQVLNKDAQRRKQVVKSGQGIRFGSWRIITMIIAAAAGGDQDSLFRFTLAER